MRRDERRAPLNSPAWEARLGYAIKNWKKNYVPARENELSRSFSLGSSNSDLPCDFKLRSLFQCKVKLSARKDSLVVGSQRKYFDFNS